jgi:hypothetical protein
MTKAKTGKGAPMQLKDSRETMAYRPSSADAKRHAQLVVCGNLNALDISEHEKIDAGHEILSALGLM